MYACRICSRNTDQLKLIAPLGAIPLCPTCKPLLESRISRIAEDIKSMVGQNITLTILTKLSGILEAVDPELETITVSGQMIPFLEASRFQNVEITEVTAHATRQLYRAERLTKSLTCPSCHHPGACTHEVLGLLGEESDKYCFRCLSCSYSEETIIYAGNDDGPQWETFCPYCDLSGYHHP